MILFSNLLVVLVALLHFYILLLEIFLWTKPLGLKIFNQSHEKAQNSRILAMNQGLYNGFLFAGLLCGVYLPNSSTAFAFKFFFLICVVIAGVFGAVSVSKRIFYVQALPAIFALIILFLC